MQDGDTAQIELGVDADGTFHHPRIVIGQGVRNGNLWLVTRNLVG